MKILIVAATWLEVRIFADELEYMGETSQMVKKYRFEDTEIDILITGIGLTFTTFHLTNVLKSQNYNLVINAGIAGSLTKELEIGEVVLVVTDEFGDLGIEKEDDFLTLFESGFMDAGEYPFTNGLLKIAETNLTTGFRKVRGITVNRSHGRTESVSEIKAKFPAQVESMEGAAVFYVCNWLGVDCLQIRAVSNYVEPRETAYWNIPLALEKLSESVLGILKKLPVAVA